RCGLGVVGRSDKPDRPLSDLRPVLRDRHRDRLCRDHRPDGALVSRPARLATGVVAAGYVFGAIATTFPIDSMLKSAGYQHTLIVFGIILGLVGAAAAL